jgi:hypothetical protein
VSRLEALVKKCTALVDEHEKRGVKVGEGHIDNEYFKEEHGKLIEEAGKLMDPDTLVRPPCRVENSGRGKKKWKSPSVVGILARLPCTFKFCIACLVRLPCVCLVECPVICSCHCVLTVLSTFFSTF